MLHNISMVTALFFPHIDSISSEREQQQCQAPGAILAGFDSEEVSLLVSKMPSVKIHIF